MEKESCSHPEKGGKAMPQEAEQKSEESDRQGQMNMGGYPNQPPYPDMQQGFQQGAGHPGQMNMGYPGGYYPNQSSHSGMKGGHSKPSHHCSGSSQQQYGPGHVSEMMGRFMTGNVTTADMNTVSSFFGIDCQNTRFWTGIALGAVGALILTKAFKS